MCQDIPHGQHNPEYQAWCFPFGLHDITKMKRMAKRFIHGVMGSHIPYNIEDLGENYLILVPLAGRTKEDVTVSLLNKHLNIKAAKPKISEGEQVREKEEKSAHSVYGFPFSGRGFTFVDVNMDIPLPADADTEKLVSKMANGLLKITMAKKPAKNINVG